MARRIHDDITGTGARAWMTWQVVDNRPGYGFLYNPLDGSGATNYSFNEKFYVMGQFSEYVRPGFQIINVNDNYSFAAYNPTNQTLVIVALNDTSSNLAMTYDLSGFAVLPATGAAVRTSPDRKPRQPAGRDREQGFFHHADSQISHHVHFQPCRVDRFAVRPDRLGRHGGQPSGRADVERLQWGDEL